MTAPFSLHAQLAELWSQYVRARDGVERNRIGAQLDALAPLVLKVPKGSSSPQRDGREGVASGPLSSEPVLQEVHT